MHGNVAHHNYIDRSMAEMGHVWTAPLRQVLIWRGDDCGRVRSCVWPVGAAILHDCWPWCGSRGGS